LPSNDVAQAIEEGVRRLDEIDRILLQLAHAPDVATVAAVVDRMDPEYKGLVLKRAFALCIRPGYEPVANQREICTLAKGWEKDAKTVRPMGPSANSEIADTTRRETLRRCAGDLLSLLPPKATDAAKG